MEYCLICRNRPHNYEQRLFLYTYEFLLILNRKKDEPKGKNTAASKRYCVGFWLSSIYLLSSVRLYKKRSYSRRRNAHGCALKALLSLTHNSHNYLTTLESCTEADRVTVTDVLNSKVIVVEARTPSIFRCPPM